MDDYQRTIRTLSDRIVLAQAPIRVLDAVKWDDSIRQGFLKAKGKEMPAVSRDSVSYTHVTSATSPGNWGSSTRSGRSCGACAKSTEWWCACSKHAALKTSG